MEAVPIDDACSPVLKESFRFQIVCRFMSQCSKSLSRLFWSLVEHIRVFSVGEGTVQTSSRHLGEKGCMLRSTFRVLIIGFSGLLYFLIFFCFVFYGPHASQWKNVL